MEEVRLQGKKCVSMKKAHFCVGGIFLRMRDFSTEEACFYSGDLFYGRGCVQFYRAGLFLRKGQIKSNRLITCMKKEEPMRGADECLCTDSVVLKCEAVVLVGHCFLIKPGLEQTRF